MKNGKNSIGRNPFIAADNLAVRFFRRFYPSLMVLLFMLGAGKSLNTVNAQCDDFIVTLMYVPDDLSEINFCVSSADGLPANWTISNTGTDYPFTGANEACITVQYITPATFVVTFEQNGVSCMETVQLGDGGCPEDIITTTVGSCGEAGIAVNLDPSEINVPYWVNFGDGTTQIVNDFELTHNYPCSGGVFDVCATFSDIETNHYRTCCEPVVIPNCGCCHTADFVIQEVLPTPSCLNRIFEITPLCPDGGNNAHKWEFEDGTVIYGPTVPLHHFTDFVNDDGYVWVRHTVTCCGTSLIEEKNIPFSPGAYLGWPNEDRKFTDVLPAADWNGNMAITVEEFLAMYSTNPGVPLFIDGRLIGDDNAIFTGGGWNMGFNSSIEIQGASNNATRFFTLYGVLIQSPVRLGPFYGGCCRWKGIKSSGKTRLTFRGARVYDAEIMLEYKGPITPAFSKPPEIDFVSNFFENNQTLIKSFGYPFKVTKFEENSIIGRLDPPICDCIANNAFDLRNITSLIAFPYTITNDVTAYEQGFHLENTRLDVKGFLFHDLENCMGANPDLDDGIGISFAWTNSLNSALTLDFLEFENMATSVRERVSAGKHTLKANASVPFSFGPASIKMAEVGKGYDIELTGSAITNTSIKGNDIATNGAIENFGVSVKMASQNNTVLAEGNKVVCSGGSASTRGIEVITTSTLGTTQNVKVLNNVVNAESTTATGAGVIVTRANGARVANNNVEVSNDFNGIEVGNSSKATISCNNISEANDGIMVNSNVDMIVDANTISISSENSLDVTGNCNLAGSKIWWNDFEYSQNEGVFYSSGTLTGTQEHKKYNSWLAQFGVELKHGNIAGHPNVTNSRFWRPSGALQPSINFPLFDPPGFMIVAPVGPGEARPMNYCGEDITPNIVEPDPEETAARHAEFIAGLTANSVDGAYAALLQGEYGFLFDNPGWMTFEPALDSFYNAQSPGFVGQSVQVQHQMLALQQTMFAQHNSRQPLNTVRDSLLGVLNWIAEQVEQTTDPSILTSLETQANSIHAQIEAIELSLSTMLAADDAANAVEMASLHSMNALLSDTAIYMANERKVNELTLKHWSGQALSEQEADTLRVIAQTCYELTGRSGFMARTLCLVALGEYYRESACPAVEPRSKLTPASVSSTLQIAPNPVSGILILTLAPDWSDKSLTITIKDGLGRNVMVRHEDSTPSCVVQLDVSSLMPGQYYLSASSAMISETVSFVVQNR